MTLFLYSGRTEERCYGKHVEGMEVMRWIFSINVEKVKYNEAKVKLNVKLNIKNFKIKTRIIKFALEVEIPSGTK